MDVRVLLDKTSGISSKLANLGSVSLIAMMLITVVDVVGRYIFNAPILGAFEITEYLVLILIFSYLGFTQAVKGHVLVEVLVNRFPEKMKVIVEIINHLLCFLFLLIITWRGIVKALELMSTRETSPNLAIPDYPFVFFLVIGALVMSIEYLRDAIYFLTKYKELKK